MTKQFFWARFFAFLLVFSLVLSPTASAVIGPTKIAQAAPATQPVVAIHVSELTQALDVAGQFHTTWWRYFVIPESLKIAFESDGTPYVVVTDAEIASGALMDGASPRYPIVFSLATEAVADNEIQPLRDYVDAGGFLFLGSSAFTRTTDGTARGNFALATEMGLNTATSTLNNWVDNVSFTRTTDHRLVSHIPAGTVNWQMLNNAEEIVWATPGNQQLWRTTSNGAEILATASGYPLITTKGYGEGRFIYHSIFNPIVGAGGQDSGMYAYTIYRSAVEWAFEAANLPIIKRSPWPYAYDAALMIRHDFENNLGNVALIDDSAAYETSIGVKGDYYFCTGQLRTLASGQQAYIDQMRSAVTNSGATIGSHNGGYFNPDYRLSPGAYDYWHWGPDTMIDRTNFDPDYSSYNGNGYGFAKDSIEDSFQDLEGWLAGTDNGRAGCGALGNCPRTWVSPRFDSGRDRSLKIFEELSASVMGEQKVSPFPHWTLSYDPTNLDHRYAVVALPPSDWYVGTTISQSQEAGHNTASIQAMVDFYYQKGYLLNLYGHNPTTTGNMKIYADYAITKPDIWKTNAVGIYDWWVKRDTLVVTPTYSKTGQTATAAATISGSSDPQAAIELVLPNWSLGVVGNPIVYLNGSPDPANPSEYRLTNYGVKVRVGTSVTSVVVTYAPLEGWVQTDWVGGAGQATWSDTTRYASSANINTSVSGQFSLNQASAGAEIWSDAFNRDPDPLPDPVTFTWTIPTTTPGATNNGIFNTIGATLNTRTTSVGQVGFTYPGGLTGTWTDYSVEADIKMPAGSTGGGGIAGRMNFSTGARYGIWIYPSTNTLRLIKFSNYGAWNSPNGLAYIVVPGIGTGWHHMKMVFSGANIKVYIDNNSTATIDATDPGLYGGGVYANGYVGFDYWTQANTSGPSLNNFVVRDSADTVLFQDDFGVDPVVQDLLSPPWSYYTGAWSIIDHTMRSTAGGLGNYSNIYYNPATAWTDYSVQAQVQFPSGAAGGGLAGRLNPTTGTRYTAWVYPGTSLLRLIRWSDWDSWPGAGNPGVWDASIPLVGNTWHTAKLDFSGSRIRVYWDGGLLIDAVDSTYTGGGISLDTAQGTGAYLMAVDDVVVSGPSLYQASGVLTSSAFDGGVGVQWHTASWNAAIPASTSICMRTRTADRSDLLAAEAWSACYATSGAAVTSLDRRWIQYQVELGTSDLTASPFFYESGITYTPGEYRPASYLNNISPTSGDSQTSVNLSATLLDESSVPIVGRTVSFTLDGLAPVTGITGTDGVATALLALNFAPGVYPLAISFAGDGSYAPISVNTTFDVTETWSEWIQDTGEDFSNGSCTTGVDVTSRAGSIILCPHQYGEGEEPGPFTLGSGTYNYRRHVYIDNPNTASLLSGYTLKLAVDTAALVSADKLLASGDDLRIVWTGGGAPLELDRVADTAFNTASTELWFKSQAAIPGSTRDSSYYIYYNNPSAGAPPANPASVFALYDGFDDGTINTALWTQAGTVTESGGWAHLSASGDLYSQQTFTYSTMEVNIQVLTQNNYMWWGWEDGISDAPNFIVFEEFPTAPNFAALMKNDGLPYESMPLSDPSNWLTTPHTYATEWRPGLARWTIDGVQVHSDTTGVPDTAMHINLYTSASASFNVDWVRTRLLAAQEPVVTLASAYTGYVTQGTYTSPTFDTGGMGSWKYLVWDEVKPAGTGLALRIRTAATEAELASASWVSYPQSGALITNPAARWIQYEADLTTQDTLITPELQKVTTYYDYEPTAVLLSSFTGSAHLSSAQLDWDTANELNLLGFNIYRSTSIDGAKEKRNTDLIEAKNGSMAGASYQFIDNMDPGQHYFYWLEIVKTSGDEFFELPVELYTDYVLFLPLTFR